MSGDIKDALWNLAHMLRTIEDTPEDVKHYHEIADKIEEILHEHT